MTTIAVQIGNSDDKLVQKEWSKYAEEVGAAIGHRADQVHFAGASNGTARWQNAAWIFTICATDIPLLRTDLIGIRRQYQQDSVAWTEGGTLFI